MVTMAACGDGSTAQAGVAAPMASLDPDLVLIAGDLNYPLGSAATIDAIVLAAGPARLARRRPGRVGARVRFPAGADSSDPSVGGLWISNAAEIVVQ
jgi:hypothetical protein